MAAIIEIKGNKAKILGETDYMFLDGLDLELSYMIAGAEYSQNYIRGRWDGRKRLLNNDLTFPIGLINRVKEYFDDNKKEVLILDKNSYTQSTPKSILDKLSSLNKKPRQYQIDSANLALEKKRGIIRCCTGGGKTLVSALITASIGKKTTIYVIGKDLLWQFHRFFSLIFDEEIGVIGDGECKIRDINIASIWSVGQAFGMRKKKQVVNDDESDNEKCISSSHYERIKRMVYSSELSIMDECHLAAAETMQKISASMRSEYAFGMSASPYREDNADLLIEAIFGKIIVNISASELIKQNYLVTPHIRFLKTNMKNTAYKTYPEIYKNCIVENEERNNLIVKGAEKLVEQDFITMVLFKELKHGKILYDKLNERNMNFHILDGSDSSKNRQYVLEEIENGKCKLVLASSIFDIGVDIPSLSGLILAGGGKSQVRGIQRIGRVIRPYEGKTMAAIIDFYDGVKYLKEHSIIRKTIYQSEDGFVVE